MRPTDLPRLYRFYIIAQEGGVLRAAERLNMSQPALSESLAALEYSLKTKLFDRLPKGVRLTAQGERLYQFSDKMFQDLDRFETLFYEKDEELQGDLKIITMPHFAAHWLISNMKAFLKQHPKINLHIAVEDVDKIQLGGHDVAIGAFIPHQPDLIQEELTTVTMRLFASQEYLEKFGTPQEPQDLDHHQLLIYDNYLNWVLRIGQKKNSPLRKPYLKIRSTQGLISGALNGLGIIDLPDFKYIMNLGLTEIFPNIPGPQVPLYFIYRQEHRSSTKIICFKDYLMQKTDEI